MNYLALDTSGKNLTVVIKNGDKIYKYFDCDCGVNHSVDIMVQTEKLLENSKTEIKELDFVAVVVGAGSFTGIRIGVATAKAICLSCGIPCLSITSFDVMAYNKDEGRFLAVIDAKHNGYYVCGYDNLKIDYAPSFIDGETLLKLKKEYKIISAEKLPFESEIVDVCQGLINAVEKKAEERTMDMGKIVPLYLRKSQAEENR